MKTLEDSVGLAESLVSVANGAGLKTGALITDMNQPLASAAGNWLEVKNAIDFLTGAHRDPRLEEVTLALCAHGLILGGMALDYDDGFIRAKIALDSGAAAEKFFAMANALGSWHDLEKYVPGPVGVVRALIASPASPRKSTRKPPSPASMPATRPLPQRPKGAFSRLT